MQKIANLPFRKLLIIFILTIFIFSMSLIILPGKIYGATLNVGPGETYAIIQSAINEADPDDTIMVAAGTYTENLTITKNITLIGAEASSTIIEPASGRCIYISGANVDISGFTITGGNDSILGGG
ncbi:MAG: hypothetical protein PHU65_08660, partial [Actinomycetota bacterium]|nr:hypothetical protein [Actinomycetota bacterium]